MLSKAGMLPTELIEDPKFVPWNAEDPRYGAPVIHCTEDMIDQPLLEAVHVQQPDLGILKVAKPLPRICLLSGLTGEEMMMFINAFPETGLEPSVFAALVPNGTNKPVREVMEEIMGDHEMMAISPFMGNPNLLLFASNLP